MRVSAISSSYHLNNTKRVQPKVQPRVTEPIPEVQNAQQNVAFKSTGGKICGALLGAGIAGLIALSGGAGLAVFYLSEAGGACIGKHIGHLVTGDDD